jgi:hypothetical protein
MDETGPMTCLLCGGTGTVERGTPTLSPEEADQMAVSVVTIALDHLILGDGQAASMDELLAVMGEAPLRDVPTVLGVVASIAAYLVDGFSRQTGDDPRQYWERIAQHMLRQDD